MISVDAAYKILEEAEEPLHYKNITKRMIKKGLWKSSGKTPWSTVGRDITEEIKVRGKNSRFARVGRGMYALSSPAVTLLKSIQGNNCALSLRGTLVEWSKAGFNQAICIDVRPDLACVIAGWPSLSEEDKKKILMIVKQAHGSTSREISR